MLKVLNVHKVTQKCQSPCEEQLDNYSGHLKGSDVYVSFYFDVS